jgi:hypothetical protein
MLFVPLAVSFVAFFGFSWFDFCVGIAHLLTTSHDYIPHTLSPSDLLLSLFLVGSWLTGICSHRYDTFIP